MVRDYELTFILSTALDEEASAAVVERVNQLILGGSGSVTEVHAWGRRRLAYPIEHQRDGFYITTRFSMPTLAVHSVDNDLRLNENILRHLIVRQDEVPIRPIVPAPAQGVAPAVSGSQAADAELSAEGVEPDAVLDGDADLDVEYAPDAEE